MENMEQIIHVELIFTSAMMVEIAFSHMPHKASHTLKDFKSHFCPVLHPQASAILGGRIKDMGFTAWQLLDLIHPNSEFMLIFNSKLLKLFRIVNE